MNMDYILVLHLNIIQYHLFHIKIEDISSSLATSNQIYRVALHRSVNRLIQANVSSMRPSPSNPGSAQQFKPLFVQLPGLIIRQCLESSDTGQMLLHEFMHSFCPICSKTCRKHLALQWLSYRWLVNSGLSTFFRYWIQIRPHFVHTFPTVSRS